MLPNSPQSTLEQYLTIGGRRTIGVISIEFPGTVNVKKGDTVEIFVSGKREFLKNTVNGEIWKNWNVEVCTVDGTKGMIPEVCIGTKSDIGCESHFVSLLKHFAKKDNRQDLIVRICILTVYKTEVAMFFSAVVQCFKEDFLRLWDLCVFVLDACCHDSKHIAGAYQKNEEAIYQALLSKAEKSNRKDLLQKLQSKWMPIFKELYLTHFGEKPKYRKIDDAVKERLLALNESARVEIKKPSPEPKPIVPAQKAKPNNAPKANILNNGPKPKAPQMAPQKKEDPPVPKPIAAQAQKPNPPKANVLNNAPNQQQELAPKAKQIPKNAQFSPQLPRFDCDNDLVVVKELGRGGQALAVLVKVKTLYQPVVAKIFLEWEEEDHKEACLKEIECLSQFIVHPNIVRIFGAVYDNKKPMGMLMEFCEDGSLADAIYDSDYAYYTAHIVRWSLHAASALMYLHKNKVLHRDVKPDNMLLCNKRKLLKVSDFGWVKEIPKDDKNARMSKIQYEYAMGTPGYVAPEVDQKKDYNEKLDVYSYGVSVWEMVNRQQPQTQQWKSPGGSKHAWLNSFLALTMNKNADKRPTMAKAYQILEKEMANRHPEDDFD